MAATKRPRGGREGPETGRGRAGRRTFAASGAPGGSRLRHSAVLGWAAVCAQRRPAQSRSFARKMNDWLVPTRWGQAAGAGKKPLIRHEVSRGARPGIGRGSPYGRQENETADSAQQPRPAHRIHAAVLSMQQHPCCTANEAVEKAGRGRKKSMVFVFIWSGLGTVSRG